MRIGLGQEDERRRAALPGDQEEALEAPRRERVVERVGHDDDVDVRGDDGRRARIVRHAALEQCAALEHGGDAVAVDDQPVADREVGVQMVGGHAQLAARGAQGGKAAVDAHRARGRGGVMAELCELGGAALVPDEPGKRRGHSCQRGSPTG